MEPTADCLVCSM